LPRRRDQEGGTIATSAIRGLFDVLLIFVPIAAGIGLTIAGLRDDLRRRRRSYHRRSRRIDARNPPESGGRS